VAEQGLRPASLVLVEAVDDGGPVVFENAAQLLVVRGLCACWSYQPTASNSSCTDLMAREKSRAFLPISS